jgi:alkylmercury lyase
VSELNRRIADLRAMRDSLDRLLATCFLPRAERECALLQSIEQSASVKEMTMNADDVKRRAGVVWWEKHHEQFEGFALVPHIAAASGWPAQDVEAALRRQPGVDWDEDGRVVGFGLTLRPTPHRFTSEGRTFFAFCSSDALQFPVVLGLSGVVESTCPVTGQPIRVEVTPERVEKVDPSGAVVSLVRPDSFDDVRGEICALGLFFASREAAAEWLAAHPDGMVHTIEEDFELHREVMEKFGWAFGDRRTATRGEGRASVPGGA